MHWYSTLTLAQNEPAPVPPGQTPGPAAPGDTTTTTAREGASDAQGDGGAAGGQNPYTGIILVTVFIVLMWVMISVPQKREKKRHEALMSALKKGDKVETIGGIIGTVLEVRDKEVVVKVDEGSNAKIRFTRSAIRSVLESGKE